MEKKCIDILQQAELVTKPIYLSRMSNVILYIV